MPDQLTYSNLSSFYESPLSADAERASMATAIGAISNGAQSYMRENTLESLAVAAQAVAKSQAEIDESRRSKARADLFDAKDGQEENGSFDHELVVGSLLDDVNSVLADVEAETLEVTPELVSLLATSFADMLKFVAGLPQSLAEEVGETAAATCTLLENRDADASAIVALFEAAG